MARGRHRVSPALHRRLTPLTVAGFSVAVAAGAWFAPAGPHGAVPPALTGLAAAGGVFAAVLMRRWDRLAGKRVADLTTARARDEWRTEERVAELETDVEEARELRQRLEAALGARRAELAALRNEHAELLRRYAYAETERARVLESRRLAVAATASARAIAPATGPTPELFRRAEAALLSLARNAARQQALRTLEAARRREAAAARADGDGEERSGRHAQPDGAHPHPEPPTPGGRPVREHHLVPAVASAVAPAPAPRPANRTVGGFDFFGVHKSPDPQAPARPVRTAAPAPERAARPVEYASAPRQEVIDLTAHDDTEPLDVRELRAHG